MSKYTLEGTLAHYGVKGMRWGQSTVKSTGAGSGKTVAAKSEQPVKKTVVPAKPKRQMSPQARTALIAAGLLATRIILREMGHHSSGEVLQGHVGPDGKWIPGKEKTWAQDMNDRPGGPMFNPKARLDPSQVEVRK